MTTAQPLWIDTNAFCRLSDKGTYELLLNQLDQVDNKQAQELAKALKAPGKIKHPTMFIELFGLAQKTIHQGIENKILSSCQEIKNKITPDVKKLRQTDEQGIFFSTVFEILHDKISVHLKDHESLLSLQNLEEQLKRSLQPYSDPSQLFLTTYLDAKNRLNADFRDILILDLSIEAIFRYGKNIISKLYTGDIALKQQWSDFLDGWCFECWKNKINRSAYRLVGEELHLLNEKHRLEFFRATKLGPYDDTIDGYIVHALSFGWFGSSQNLSSISAFSEDPFDEVFKRVKQYQTYLAYAINPIGTPVNAPARILLNLKPGTLYSLNHKESVLTIVSFNPATMLAGDPSPIVQHSHSEIVEIKLKYSVT